MKMGAAVGAQEGHSGVDWRWGKEASEGDVFCYWAKREPGVAQNRSSYTFKWSVPRSELHAPRSQRADVIIHVSPHFIGVL